MPGDLVGSSLPLNNGRGAAGAAPAPRFGDFLSAAARVPQLGGTAAARGCRRGRRSRAALVVLMVSVRVKTPRCSAEHRGHRKLGVRRPTASNSCGRIACCRVRDRWFRSAAPSPNERSVFEPMGASFTLREHTGLELSGNSRALCFRRVSRSPAAWELQRACAEPRRGRAIGDAILFRRRRDLAGFR